MPASGSNRSFGLIFCAFFTLVAFAPLFRHAQIRPWALLVAVAMLIIALTHPNLLAWPNLWWTKFGELLHAITSPVALFFIYFLAILPVGLAFRLKRKDPLRRKFEPESSSYWIHRTPHARPDAGMQNPF